MGGRLHYNSSTGYWWVENSDGIKINFRANPKELLQHCEGISKNLSALLIAQRLALEVKVNGGLFGFFLSSAGVIAPNAHAALRRLGLTETAAVLHEAMSLLGRHFPQHSGKRRAILMQEWVYDAPKGDLTDRLRNLTATFYLTLGGKGFPMLKKVLRASITSHLRDSAKVVK